MYYEITSYLNIKDEKKKNYMIEHVSFNINKDIDLVMYIFMLMMMNEHPSYSILDLLVDHRIVQFKICKLVRFITFLLSCVNILQAG